ncbi:MAG: carboxypeptidase-like regulatory domain-containing protein, partial [Spirosomataceae bacterium]
MKISAFVLLFIWATNNVFAQDRYTLNGYVKDANNGEGLIGVSVYVRENASGVATNPYGFYSLTLPTGDYTLIYSYVGYAKKEVKVSLTTDLTLDVELEEAARELEEVVVSVEREDENVKSVEMSVNKLEIKTIKKMPALLGEVDLIKSIQLLPGVSTVGEGSSGF